jgi:DNA-binding CsgD family transcriptional regulator
MTIPDEQVPYLLTALEHYVAYMRATGRNEHPYAEIAETLKRKPTTKQTSEPSAKRKRG